MCLLFLYLSMLGLVCFAFEVAAVELPDSHTEWLWMQQRMMMMMVMVMMMTRRMRRMMIYRVWLMAPTTTTTTVTDWLTVCRSDWLLSSVCQSVNHRDEQLPTTPQRFFCFVLPSTILVFVVVIVGVVVSNSDSKTALNQHKLTVWGQKE